MKSIEAIYEGYGKVRAGKSPRAGVDLLAYDLFRLLDATWSFKNKMEEFPDKLQRLSVLMGHDNFGLILVCERYIDKEICHLDGDRDFRECWKLFKSILGKMSNLGEEMSNDLVLSLARLLFISALVFNMSNVEAIENIISNPKARPPGGLFLASDNDIRFCKTLPGNLNGSFSSISDVYLSLQKNLEYYLFKIEQLHQISR